MTKEVQKVPDILLARYKDLFVIIDDIELVAKGTKSEQLEKVREFLKVMDETESQLKMGNCISAKRAIERLGFKLTSSGFSLINTKVQGITEKLKPTNLRELRSFLGAVKQFTKLTPDLAAIWFPFRSIYKKNCQLKLE